MNKLNAGKILGVLITDGNQIWKPRAASLSEIQSSYSTSSKPYSNNFVRSNFMHTTSCRMHKIDSPHGIPCELTSK